MTLLQKDETLSAWADVQATPERVYEVVSDISRTPEWSPETVRVQWLGPDRFKAWNRRRLGRWSTVANVVKAVPGQEFSFIVQAMGDDWTQWSYLMEPGPVSGTTRLTETVRMCVALPIGVVMFERLFLLVRDRRSDLQHNLQTSVDRIRAIVESGVAA